MCTQHVYYHPCECDDQFDPWDDNNDHPTCDKCPVVDKEYRTCVNYPNCQNQYNVNAVAWNEDYPCPECKKPRPAKKYRSRARAH